jgi:hypothetical protein
MRKKIISSGLALVLVMVAFSGLMAWGTWGHTHVNRYAVKCLPADMQGFFGKNADFLSEHSVDPDRRRNLDPTEGYRHFIDYDYICNKHECNVPHRWEDAVNKYGMDSLKHTGIVPWNTASLMAQLTDAFKKKDKWEILRLCSDIGHYVADAHVPFHATSNYDGQKTHQRGIHSLWESTVVDQQNAGYNFENIASAEYIKSPVDYMFDIITYSATEVDSALQAENIVISQFDSTTRFQLQTRKNGTTYLGYTPAFTAAYQKQMNNMEARKLRMAVHAVASMWYTAWVDAGKPDLNTVADVPMPAEYKAMLDKMNEGRRDY